MNKKRVFLCAFSLLLIFSAEARKAKKNAPPPAWASSETIGEIYPSSEFIARTGYASSPENALAFAEAELGKYFEHSVESSMSASQTQTSRTGANTTDERTLQRKVLVTSNAKLFAVNHTEPYFEEKSQSYVVCAFIDRREAWKLYEPKVVQAQKNFLAQFEPADDEPDSLKKFIRMKKTSPLAWQYADILDFAHAIYPAKAESFEKDREKIARVDEAILSARLEATMLVSVTDDFENRAKRKISDLLAGEQFVLSDRAFAYRVSASIERNKVIHPGEDNIITATPGITVTISNGSENLFTYAKTFKRISGFSDEFIDKKMFDAIEKELEKSFLEELWNSLQ